MTKKNAQDWVTVGALRGPHGLRGMVKAKIGLDDPDMLLSGPVVAEDGRQWRVKKWQQVGQGLLALQLEGVASIEAAEGLRGIAIKMDRSGWAVDEGEVFVAALVGMVVRDAVGDEVGRVVAVTELPAGPAVEIEVNGKRGLVPVAVEFMAVAESITLTELGEDVLQVAVG
ncbi:MAG: 16S rRNA processing protein RimM [Proteobacteria bacterium]|nr:16S rRNA processing protein RimM [Pseudomonadota bacterium]